MTRPPDPSSRPTDVASPESTGPLIAAADPPLDAADEALVRAALAHLDGAFVAGRHEVAAAVRMRSGAVHVGVHVESSIGRASICAEGVAVGVAVGHGAREIDTCVAVLRTDEAGGWRVVTPCGLCRELLSDYGRDAQVIDYRDGRVAKVPVADLLPGKTRRRWDAAERPGEGPAGG
jgi:cytidine deaminase